MSKNLIAVIAVVFIVVAVGFIIKTTAFEPKGAAYDKVYNKMIDVMDTKTGQVVQVKQGVWEKEMASDPATGYKIDSKTGDKLASIVTCISCGAKIAAMPMSPADMENPEKTDQLRNDYKCPKCGKNAYEPMPPPPPK